MGCESCKSAEKHMESIPYAAHESIIARMERTIKRLVIAIIVMIIVFFANNAILINAWCQYDYTSKEVPAGMQMVWDWEHDKIVDNVARIRSIMDMYKK